MGWLGLPEAMRARLIAVPEISAVIGSRLHYQELPQDSPLPHAWFRRTGNQSDGFMDWDDDEGVTVDRYSMEIVANRDVSALIDAIQLSLQSWQNTTVDGRYLQLVEIEDADDDYVFLDVGASEADYLHALQIVVYHAA